MDWQTIKTYVIENASQPSTWRGVIYVLTAAGVQLSPDQQNAIVSIGLGLAGLVALVFKDKTGGANG